MATNKPAQPKQSDTLLAELRDLIDAARQHVAQTANATLTMLYWHVGHRIGVELLKKERAPYGQEMVSAVSRELTLAYGKGFTDRNLWHMKRFAEAFPDEKIVSSLSTVLSWTHFRHIIYLERPLQREFYAEMCRIERWSTRTLEKKIGGMLYERTAISKKPEAVVGMEIAKMRAGDLVNADLVFRDPYLLDFLGLQGAYSERDLEAAILADMERFLLEMGDGFCFRVAEYLTELPDREALRTRLHQAIALAREQAARIALPQPPVISEVDKAPKPRRTKKGNDA
ncbi:MAG: DUF1016 family protein [Methylococcaceae bacterium]|nr:MAG: DUF1016 family protein [Methylococcaceae bacterium]